MSYNVCFSSSNCIAEKDNLSVWKVEWMVKWPLSTPYFLFHGLIVSMMVGGHLPFLIAYKVKWMVDGHLLLNRH